MLMTRAITSLLSTFSGQAWHEPSDFKLDEALFVDLLDHDLSSVSSFSNLMQATARLHIHVKGAAGPRSDGTVSTSAF